MSADLTQTLASLTLQLNRIVPIFQLSLGTFGNTMNIFIFTRRSLRSNPCSFYFLCSSINNIFALYVALLTRLLASGWKIDPSSSSNILCKLRIFFVYISLCLIQWFIVLASIDRYLSSCRSAGYRKLSSLSMARKATPFLVLFTTLAHFHILIWWTSDYAGSTLICNVFIPAYDISFWIFYLIFTSLLPPILMTVFGVKTILNVQKLRRQVAPQNNNTRNESLRSKDRQMITMLLVQVLLTIICTTPFSVINLYSAIEDNIETSSLSPSATAIYNFSANVCRLLNYFGPVVGFYIYTLTGRTFRVEIRNGFKKLIIITGLDRLLPVNVQRILMEQEGTLTMNQLMTMTKARVPFTITKHPNRTSKRQLSIIDARILD